MSSVLPAFDFRAREEGVASMTWLIALGGFAALYLPVYWVAGNGIWQSDENGHGSLILGVLVWLFWSVRKGIATAPVEPARLTGAAVFAVGLLLYLLGRATDVLMLAIASQPFVVAGILLLLSGPRALRLAWFPVLYFIFMIPLPGTLVDQITGPLKQWISVIVVELLYNVGYPVSRNGVVLEVGQYQMLVADACSGLNSMFSLSALGTLFMYIAKRPSIAHNAIMVMSILPIAFVANIVRVLALILITYHFGDEAGQGFLHGAAGMSLMLVALVCFFSLDKLLEKIMPASRAASAAPAPTATPTV